MWAHKMFCGLFNFIEEVLSKLVAQAVGALFNIFISLPKKKKKKFFSGTGAIFEECLNCFS